MPILTNHCLFHKKGHKKRRVIYEKVYVIFMSLFNDINYSSWTTHQPEYGVVGTSTSTYDEYDRYLTFRIHDRIKLALKETSLVYEARVKSTGRKGNSSIVMPTMIEAVFKNFPRESGKTETYMLKIEE